MLWIMALRSVSLMPCAAATASLEGAGTGEPPAGGESCPACRRLVRRCPHCGTGNRAFASFCRACGRALPETAGEWTAFKGGAQRLGLDRWPSPTPLREAYVEPILDLRLGAPCRSLLSADRHLIAVDADGGVTVADVARGAGSAVTLRSEGPVSAEPCVSRGLLFLASPGRVAAYPLGHLDLPVPRREPRWEVPVPGTPIQALLVLDDRLYLTLLKDGDREGWRIPGIDGDSSGSK